MFRVVLALGLIAGVAGSAAAEDVFQRPESCVLVATAQYDDCTVVNSYRCADGGPVAFVAETSGATDLTIETFDGDHGRIEMFGWDGNVHMKVVTKAFHPRQVLVEKRRPGTLYGTFTAFGVNGPILSDFSYTYNDETLPLAGEIFHRIHKEGSTRRGPPVSHSTEMASLLYNEKLDLLILEVSETIEKGAPILRLELKSLALEGQDGFGFTQPTHGCTRTSGLRIARTERSA